MELLHTDIEKKNENQRKRGTKKQREIMAETKKEDKSKEDIREILAFKRFKCNILCPKISEFSYRLSPYTDCNVEMSFVKHSTVCQH
jgi:hypothetical protein